MKCAIILERLLRFDLGTTSPILGKPKFVTLADEISFNDIGCMLQLAVDNVDQPYLLVFL